MRINSNTGADTFVVLGSVDGLLEELQRLAKELLPQAALVHELPRLLVIRQLVRPVLLCIRGRNLQEAKGGEKEVLLR
jgi:hypothetical protein